MKFSSLFKSASAQKLDLELTSTFEFSLPEEIILRISLDRAQVPPGSASLASTAEMFASIGESRVADFLAGVELGDRGSVHDASQKFYTAFSCSRSSFGLEFDRYGKNLLISIGRRETSRAAEIDEAGLLLNAYSDGLVAINGVLDQHPAVIEALSLAVIRHLCIAGEIESAYRLTQKLLKITRKSIHLRAVEAAVGYLLRQEPVPAHLSRFVSDSYGALSDRFCPVPFSRADIHQTGEVIMCCTHWLPTVIGNVFSSSADEILNSTTAKDIRKSVVDGSFKYCSHCDCELLVNDKLPRKQDYAGRDYDDEYYHVDKTLLREAFSGKEVELSNISYLIFCLDRTCNLSCPSCRQDVIMVKGDERDRLYHATERGVLPMLKNAKRVMINPSGEAFVSRPSRRLLEKLADPGYESLIVDVITNGSVCDQAEWDKFSHLYGRIHILRVSIDGASKPTIEKLRRGINYETLIQNLENLKRMHRAGRFRYFFASFTYQRDNLAEMEEFLEFTNQFGVSTVIFERLQNVGTFSSAEYAERAIHLVDHPDHNRFLQAVRKVKRDPRVSIDFSL